MIIVQLNGGLGNQMFQYSSALALAKISHQPLYLDCSKLKKDHKRKFRLREFNVDDKECGFVIKSYFYLKSNMPSKIRKNYFYHEPFFHFDPNFLKSSTDVLLTGYWQSPLYFNHLKLELLRRFTPSDALPSASNHLPHEMACGETVAMHIRRGDYVHDREVSSIHGFCGANYYLNSLKFLEQKQGKLRIYIFTDDPSWAKREMSPFIDDCTIVSGSYDLNDAQELWVMGFAKHHIISNSTFGWWGAWLRKRDDGFVIAPRVWFAGSDNRVDDLIPSEWIRL
jgi:hypothetical protein